MIGVGDDSAAHFQTLLQEMPPDVSSRANLAHWFCKAHNNVNERLGKPQYDCAKVTERWKCGCPEEIAADPTLHD